MAQQQMVRISCGVESDGQSLHITPRGPNIGTRDGRAFTLSNPERVIAMSRAPLLIDWEHDSEKFGGSTRAAGWLLSLSLESSGIWGKVQWSTEGKADIESGAYRYLSPVLILNSDTREVEEIASVALTNTPALSMSEIGVEAYRRETHHRVACSMAHHSAMADKDREALLAAGFSEAQLGRVEAYRAQRDHQDWAGTPIRKAEQLREQLLLSQLREQLRHG